MPAPTPPSVRDLLATSVARLQAAGVDTARNDAEWLLADALGVRRFDLYLTLGRAVEAGVAGRYRAAIARRARREPLQQVLGWESFRGLRLRVTPAVLVPRPETESLAEWALALLAGRPAPLVVDVGAGSGCLACAIAAARPDARVLALERSPAAAAVAAGNAHRLGLAGRVTTVIGDLLEPVAGAADLVVSNPPYLGRSALDGLPPEVARHEPRLALDGGPDGLAVIRRLVGGARARLAGGGALALETAGGAQAARVAALFGEAGFTAVTVRRDLNGIERFVAGLAPARARPGGSAPAAVTSPG